MVAGRTPGPLGVGNSSGQVTQSAAPLGVGNSSGRATPPSASVGRAEPSSNREPTKDDFRRKVLAAAIAGRVRLGRKQFGAIPDNELATVEGGHRLRTAVAADFQKLMAAAREALAIQQMGPPADNAAKTRQDFARSVKAIGLGSGYRTRETELIIWNNLFPQYYAATEASRAAAEGGRHGDAAVAILVNYYNTRKAPPGFSNHSDGRAVDFTTTQAGVTYGANGNQRAGWRATWLHQWLVANAGRFNFQPLASEEWHWDHN